MSGEHPAGANPRRMDRTTTLERLLAIDATTVEAALSAAAALVADALQADKVDALLYDAAADAWSAQGVSPTPLGQRERALGLDHLPRAEAHSTTAVHRSETPFLTGHAEREPAVPRALVEDLGVRSLLEVPLEIGGERRGVLAVAAQRPEAFSALDVLFLQSVARWVGLVAHRAVLAEQAVREAARAARAAAQATHEQAARVQVERVLESIDDAFYALDHAGRFTYVNQHTERLWGKQRADLLGQTFLAVFPQARGSANYGAIARALAERVTVPFENRSPILGTWIAGRVYPTPDGVAVYFHDISVRKRLEEERAELVLWEREARQSAQSSAARLEAVQAVTDAALGAR